MTTTKRIHAAIGALVLGLSLTATAPNAEAGDAFFRGGLLFHPTGIDFAQRWFLSIGSDYGLNLDETIFAGVEIQGSAFRQDTTGGSTAWVIPANGFFNVKYKSPSFGMRPYAGGGIGMVTNFVFVDGSNDWSRELAWHILGGIEFGRTSVELQVQRAFETGSTTSYSVLAGFVW